MQSGEAKAKTSALMHLIYHYMLVHVHFFITKKKQHIAHLTVSRALCRCSTYLWYSLKQIQRKHVIHFNLDML